MNRWGKRTAGPAALLALALLAGCADRAEPPAGTTAASTPGATPAVATPTAAATASASAAAQREAGAASGGMPTEVVDADGALLIGADPKVLRAEDGAYYMYATEANREVPTWRSRDMVKWERIESAVSRWAYVTTGGADDAKTQRLWEIWAPYVFAWNGKYVMVASGRVADAPPMEDSIYRSLFAAVSDSPAGPFEKFYRIAPRRPDPAAPHSVLNKPSGAEAAAPDFDERAVMAIDAAVLHDPVSGSDYMAYVTYGNPADESRNGNQIELFRLSGAAFADGDKPGFYYDYDPKASFEIADPQRWPAFKDIPMNLDGSNAPWRPMGGEWGDFGYERYINEAPALFYDNGWYHFYFSVNTWDSPSYQILEVRTRKLDELGVDRRESAAPGDVRYSVFQAPAATSNYGSGSVVRGPDGEWTYFMHALVPDTERTIWQKKIPLE